MGRTYLLALIAGEVCGGEQVWLWRQREETRLARSISRPFFSFLFFLARATVLMIVLYYAFSWSGAAVPRSRDLSE